MCSYKCQRVGVQFAAGARDLSLLHKVQTGCEAHPTSQPIGTGGYFTRSKAAGIVPGLSGEAINSFAHLSLWKAA
jgi:hypothetical protein